MLFKKNKIHISQVIGFQSTLRIIAFAKKNSTGTQKLAENTLRGGGMGVFPHTREARGRDGGI